MSSSGTTPPRGGPPTQRGGRGGASTPTPNSTTAASPGNDSSSAASGGAAAPPVDWRASVAQSYRSAEVRKISQELASLEKDATSQSKLMLAMRFEDGIFQSSQSLQEYHKTIAKRLKKLKKKWVAPAPDEAEAARQKELELRQRYGESLRYITKHASEAVRLMGEKHGEARATHLKQHTDNAEQWAKDLGIPLDPKAPLSTAVGSRRAGTAREQLEKLKRLQLFLEQRVDNIRGHVVKLVEPDVFLGETLSKVERDMERSTATRLAGTTRKVLNRVGSSVGIRPLRTADELRSLLDKATVPVPPPREGYAEDVTEAELVYLSRIRAASQIGIGFASLEPDQRASLSDVLLKSHEAAVEGIAFLKDHYVEPSTGKKGVVLEDAWTHLLEYEEEEDATPALSSIDGAGGASSPVPTAAPPAKRPRKPTVIRTKVLLTPGRKTPSNLLPAFESRRAKLIRPSEFGAGARLRLTFGKAFVMTIYLQPLLVNIRAVPQQEPPQPSPSSAKPLEKKTSDGSGSSGRMDEDDPDEEADDDGKREQEKQKRVGEDDKKGSAGAGGKDEEVDPLETFDFRRDVVDGNLPTWKTPSWGLTNPPPSLSSSSAGTGAGTSSASSSAAAAAAAIVDPVSVAGLSGSRYDLSPLIAQRLQFASSNATRVLRRCFQDCYELVKAGRSDFEVEISEATALLKFLQIARSTYPEGSSEGTSDSG